MKQIIKSKAYISSVKPKYSLIEPSEFEYATLRAKRKQYHIQSSKWNTLNEKAYNEMASSRWLVIPGTCSMHV